MKIEHKVIDAIKGNVRITTTDERWYGKPDNNGTILWIPSVTWIAEYYPKGIGFYKWLANHGWDEAESIKEQAGSKGGRVHKAIELLLEGGTVKHDSVIADSNGIEAEITVDEYEAIISFLDWHKETKPIVKKKEFTVFAPDNTYAGTLDLSCEIAGEPWIIDFKTSAEIWPSHEIQESAYKHALGIDNARLGILQVGYKKNKNKKYKFTEIEYRYDLFQAAYKIWEKENSNVQPKQRDFPLEISLNKGELKNGKTAGKNNNI